MPYIGNQHNVGDHVNNFKVLDDISSYTATFDGSATSVVSAADDTIRIPEHRFIQGQRVTYTNGGGGNIGGLTTGTAYFVSFDTANTIKLATTLANANSNTVINLSAVGSGTSHTLNVAFDGINTKFKMTHSSGKAARLNNATQLNVAINNVIQRPNLNPNNFTDGFALQDNHKIVFNTAPVGNDVFWGSIIANTIENFDLRDNEVDNFTGDGSTTEFTLSTIPANNESVIVSINGVVQHPSDKHTNRSYTLINSIIQFTAAPALGDEIQVRHIGFAGASTNDVSGFYGRTGNVALTSSDNITTGDITARNINASGILTASSASFGGNVSIGGTLTYEDVSNIDSVGIVTALGFKTRGTSNDGGVTNSFVAGRINIYDNNSHNIFRIGSHPAYAPTVWQTSAITFSTSSFNVSNVQSTRNYINIANSTGILKLGYGGASNHGFKLETSAKGIKVGTGVTIETNGQATYTGILTATGADINGDLDVDGHTNLDNVSVAGITTVNGGFIFDNGTNAGKDLQWQPSNNRLAFFNDVKATFGNTVDLQIYHNSTENHIYGSTNKPIIFSTNTDERLRITSGGHVNIGGNYSQTTYRLHVDGGIEATASFACVNSVSVSGVAPKIVFTDTNQDSDYTIKNDGGQLLFIDRTNSDTVRMYANTGGFGGSRLYIADDIVHTGDTDTKIEFGTDTINFDTGGSERLRIASDGKIGIGVENPDASLHIKSASSPTIHLEDTSQTTKLKVYAQDTTAVVGTYSNHPLIFTTNSAAERLRITSTGLVSIGEASPSSDVTLTVRRDVAAASGNATMQINNFYQGTANQSNQSGAEIEFKFKNHNASHNYWGGRILCDNTDNYNQYTNLQFHTASQGNAVERMRLAHDGDLTIFGKDNAEIKLKCGTSTGDNIIAFQNSGGTTKGRILYDSDNNFMVFSTNGTASSNERLRITSGGSVLIDTTVTTEATTDANDLIIGSTSDTQKGISIVGSTSGGIGNLYFTDGAGYKNQGRISYHHADDSMRFQTNHYERLRITSDGKIGIGDVDPDYMLQLKGTIPAIALEDTSGTHGFSVIEQNDDNLKIRCDAGNQSSGYNSNIRFEVDGTEKVRITSTGNVKIGSGTPGAKFHVEDTNTTAYNPAATTAAASLYLVNTGTNGPLGIILQNASTDGSNTCQATISSVAEGTNKDTALTFGTRQNSDATIRERLRIKSDGDIEATGNLSTDNLSGKNMVINGDMRVAQRATSASFNDHGNDIEVCDRWYYNRHGVTATVAQVADAPAASGFRYSLKWTSTSAVSGSLHAGNALFFLYKIERQDIQRLRYGSSSAKKATISFWAKGSLAGKIGFNCRRDGRIFSANVDMTANTWQFHEIVVPADTSTGFSANDNANGFQIGFCWGAGSNSTSGTTGSWINFHNAYTAGFTAGQQGAYLTTNGSTFQITGVQLEIGSQSTPFEFLDYANQLKMCQRYFSVYHPTTQEWIYFEGAAYNHKWWQTYVPTGMRSEPSVTKKGTCSTNNISAGGGTVSGLTLEAIDNGGNAGTAHPGSMGRASFRVNFSGNHGSARQVYHADGWGNGNGWIEYDSEL